MSAKTEIDKLASFLLLNFPEEFGKGLPEKFSEKEVKIGESAVEMAIRLLKRQEEKK